ncbi:MAG TPA: sigma-70 family RNA polymerase sigma factor [Bacteroidales bacterium]|nr:sigma-70 family RNA polymerase sigma factor [Bacteroidales bacterium]
MSEIIPVNSTTDNKTPEGKKFLQPLTQQNYRKSSSERDLIQGCSRNERYAQHELYNRYCDAMFTTSFRILNNRDDAHDALQDAFIQVFRDINQFRMESTLGAWIKTIVVRTSLRLLRKKRSPELTALTEINEDISLHIPDSMSGDYLEKAILSLPDGYRAVFLLTEVEGYSHAETAQLLGIAEGTSKSQLHHAKNLLKRRISAFVG